MDVLFKLNNNGEMILHPSMLNSKLVVNLMRRDRGGLMEGDANGKKKLRAHAEIGLIWYQLNVNSPGIKQGDDEAELLRKGKQFFRIPDEWKPDDAYEALYDWYKEYYNGMSVVKAIRSIYKSFNTLLKMLDKLQLALDHQDAGDELNLETVSETLKVNKQLMAMSADLPEQLKKLKTLEETYLKEESKKITAMGGQTVTNSMDPRK